MRFRIIELLVVVSVVGLACWSLKQSDLFFETAFYSFTLLFILGSILLAVGRKSGARVFWTGFAISSLSYLVIAHLPDPDALVPRHNGPEITTQLLRHCFNWIQEDRYDSILTPQAKGVYDVPYDQFDLGSNDSSFSVATGNDDMAKETAERSSGNLSLIVGGGQRIVADGLSVSFMRIGHAAWALFLGWIGGHFTQFVYERSRRDRTMR